MVWLILTGTTTWLIVRHYRAHRVILPQDPVAPPPKPTLNGPCPCGSGKKYKRCCAPTSR
ncbi:MAG: SEC-C metal-binding domain-containing protein [Thermodesulfobacteriota bacterium]